MAYYVSPEGDDSNTDPTDPAQAVRSLTRAMELIARDYPDGVLISETVHVAAGTYSREFGEDFPIIVPDNVEILGAGRDVCTLEYTGIPVDDVECGFVDFAVDLRGSLFDMAITNPGDHVVIEIHVNGNLAIENVSSDHVHVRRATRISNVECDVYLYTAEGDRDLSGDLYPLIEECHCPGYPGLVVAGGRAERNHARYIWLGSPGDTIFQDNHLEEMFTFVVGRSRDEPPGDDEPIPQILNNHLAHADVIEARESGRWTVVWICGEADWYENSIWANQIVIACSSLFDHNDIEAEQIELGRPSGWGSLPYTDSPMREINPEFLHNTLRQGQRWIGGCRVVPEPPAFLAMSSDARPVFEDNTIIYKRLPAGITNGVGSAMAYIQEQAVPDFGGGGRSEGRNEFSPEDYAYTTYDIVIDIGEGNTMTLFAENNVWVVDPPRIHVISGDVEERTGGGP